MTLVNVTLVNVTLGNVALGHVPLRIPRAGETTATVEATATTATQQELLVVLQAGCRPIAILGHEVTEAMPKQMVGVFASRARH